MQIKDPIKIRIKAERKKDKKWHLWYQEFFEGEDTDEAAKTTVEFTKKICGMLTETEFNVSYDPKNKCLEFTIGGDKDSVFSALAGEFLSQSRLGQISLRELLIGTMLMSLLAQPKEEKGR